MQTKKTGNGFRTVIVCIDSYDDSIPVGRLLNPLFPEAVSFKGVVEFLREMEELLNEMHFPQSFTELRSFRAVALPVLRMEANGAGPEGKLATFAVKVIFRQNASWQGSVLWMEQSREESFRSVLELIFLMDSALSPEI